MTMRPLVLVAGTLLLAACESRDTSESSQAPAATAQGNAVPRPADLRPTPALPARFGSIGRDARADEIRAWNIDVNGSGVGLPPGRGTYEAGARVFAQQCAVCHGTNGEGLPPNPALVGVEPREFVFGTDPKIAKTVGNYWPYATTLYDYINRAMPFNAPGTLTADDVYGLVAYLLAENQVIPRSATMDARSLPRVKMPAHARFVKDDRVGGPTFR